MFFVLCVVSAAFCAVSLRLFRSGWRAGGAEGWLGAAFLCIAGSMPLRWGVQRAHVFAEALEPSLVVLGHALMAAGLSAFTLFVHRVFRAESCWATPVSALLIAVQIISLPALVLFGGHRDEHHASVLAVGLCRALPFAWGFAEALRYQRLMRRRAALSLADPVVTNRFGLFAIWTGAMTAIPLLLFGVRLWMGHAQAPATLVASDGRLSVAGGVLAAGLLILGGAATVSLWLSLVPPRSWSAWIRARAAAAEARTPDCS